MTCTWTSRWSCQEMQYPIYWEHDLLVLEKFSHISVILLKSRSMTRPKRFWLYLWSTRFTLLSKLFGMWVKISYSTNSTLLYESVTSNAPAQDARWHFWMVHMYMCSFKAAENYEVYLLRRLPRWTSAYVKAAFFPYINMYILKITFKSNLTWSIFALK